MTELSNECIKDAFSKIRAKFEKRNNITGLEILDSYEEKWAAYGSLTDRQINWIEKQLDGSWQSKEKQPANSSGSHSPRPKPEFVVVSNEPPAKDPDELVDAMIRQKLKDEGKAIVDLEQFNALVLAVEILRDAANSN